jgi:hypothetical protein
MQKTILFLTFFNFSYSFLFAQNAVIEVSKMNVVAIGLDNPIEIAVPNFPSEKLEVSISGGTIQKEGEGKYNVRVAQIGQGQVIITVKAGDKITEKRFRIKAIPDPTPYVGNLKANGKIALGDLQAASGVAAPILNYDIDARCIVETYSVAIVRKNGESFSLDVKGYQFPTELNKQFDSLKSGDKVHFTNIRSRCPHDVVARHLNSLNFEIK